MFFFFFRSCFISFKLNDNTQIPHDSWKKEIVWWAGNNAMQCNWNWNDKLKKKNGICRQNTENQSENENQTEYNVCVKIQIGIERVYL